MAKRVFLEKYNGRKLEWLHDWLIFIVMVIVVYIVFRYFIGLSMVSGKSMEPALKNGEAVLYWRPTQEYKTGDVISIWVPSGDYYVKRVIAVEGDVVDIRKGRLYINNEAYEDPYGQGITEKEQGAVIYPYTVRKGNVFVLGDNREVSVDSRSFGEVNRIQIRGKILFHLGKWYIKPVEEKL